MADAASEPAQFIVDVQAVLQSGRTDRAERGEIGRQRVAPGDRIGVRQFLARFSGRQLEVALEATMPESRVAVTSHSVV